MTNSSPNLAEKRPAPIDLHPSKGLPVKQANGTFDFFGLGADGLIGAVDDAACLTDQMLARTSLALLVVDHSLASKKHTGKASGTPSSGTPRDQSLTIGHLLQKKTLAKPVAPQADFWAEGSRADFRTELDQKKTITSRMYVRLWGRRRNRAKELQEFDNGQRIGEQAGLACTSTSMSRKQAGHLHHNGDGSAMRSWCDRSLR
jgi:hypothetical protein